MFSIANCKNYSILRSAVLSSYSDDFFTRNITIWWCQCCNALQFSHSHNAIIARRPEATMTVLVRGELALWHWYHSSVSVIDSLSICVVQCLIAVIQNRSLSIVPTRRQLFCDRAAVCEIHILRKRGLLSAYRELARRTSESTGILADSRVSCVYDLETGTFQPSVVCVCRYTHIQIYNYGEC